MFNPALDKTLEAVQDKLIPYLESMKVAISSTGKFSCPNPSHSDSTPSCSIVPESRGQIFHCFGCQTSGSIYHAANFLENFPLSGPGFINTTVKTLCERFNIPFPEMEMTPEQRELLDIYRAYADVSTIIKCSTEDTFVPQFDARGWEDSIGVKYSIGFIEDFSKYLSQMKAKGYGLSFLEKIGLTRQDIFGPERMVFSILDENNTPVGFAARDPNYKEDGPTPKYINSSNDVPIYKKGEILYGFGFSKRSAVNRGLIIVEGYPDWVTLFEKGIYNCVALGGTALTKEHVQLIVNQGITKIFLCLDNDNGGLEATQRILDKVIADIPQLEASVITLPEGQDPDDYLKGIPKEEAIEHWNKLEVSSCFKWRLRRFDASIPMEDIANKMVPLIMTEPNIITREKMVKDLADHTGIRLSALQYQIDKLSRVEDFKNSERINSIVNSAIKELNRAPGSASEIMRQYIDIIEECKVSTSLDSIGVSQTSKTASDIFDSWKNRSDEIIGIRTHFVELDEALNGLQEGRAVAIGGKPNHGKSALVTNIAYNVSTMNEDCIVLHHTTDDNVETTLNRYVAIDQGLVLNDIRTPKSSFKLKTPIIVNGKQIIYDADKVARWKQGTANIQALIDSGKLVIKDSNQGTSLAYTESMIKYYKERNPGKRILTIFDNFHKATDYIEIKEERIRYKRMSGVIKNLAEKYSIAFLATMEYHKLQEGQKPTNHALGETAQIEYDLSAILHVYNELKDVGKDKTKLVMINTGSADELIPIVSLRVGKNKQGSFSESLYYYFYPSTGKWKEYPRERFLAEIVAKQQGGRFGTLATSGR